jgi:hypothetical protein
MTYDPDHLPNDPNELKRLVVVLLESDAAKQKTLDGMVAEIAKLNTTIQKLTEMLFGKKNKKLVNIAAVEEEQPVAETETTAPSVEEEKSSDTSDTPDTSETPENPAPKPPRQKKPVNGGGGRMKLPDNLPVPGATKRSRSTCFSSRTTEPATS